MGPPVLFTQDSSSLKTDSRKLKKFEYSKTGSNSEIGSFSQNFLAKKIQNNNIECHRQTIRAQIHCLHFAQANSTLKEESGLEIDLFEVIRTSIEAAHTLLFSNQTPKYLDNTTE